mmetsp:Transcript_34925/g.77646  ORF Transcript_34925/g.77646 Transcript_34925/m.77646 type:complete len:114 (-) Transcript_34925:174-515(-)
MPLSAPLHINLGQQRQNPGTAAGMDYGVLPGTHDDAMLGVLLMLGALKAATGATNHQPRRTAAPPPSHPHAHTYTYHAYIVQKHTPRKYAYTETRHHPIKTACDPSMSLRPAQ